jgi:NADPH:quinone reductase
MKAIICDRFGPIEALRCGICEDPALASGSVLIKVAAAGVNYPDVLIVQGQYQTKPQTPFVPGSEAAGVVAKVGEGVTGLALGDRVVAFTGSGAFAEYAAVNESQVYCLPDGTDLELAAGVLITYGTSYHALKDRAALGQGETLLVLGAAGGVGLAAVEIGKRLGARVIAAASSEEKLSVAREHGADETINYAAEDLRARVKALTEGRGVDVAYDPVGGAHTLAAVKSLAWGGRHLVVGFASGDIPSIPANLLLLKSAASLGVWWGTSLRADPQHHAQNIRQIFRYIADRSLRPRIDARFPLEQAVAALNHVKERKALGKVLLTVAGWATDGE